MGIDIKNKDVDTKGDSASKEKKSLLSMDIKTLKMKLTQRTRSQKAKVTRDKKRNVVSFDIGSNTTKIVQGIYYKGKLSIDSCIKIKTPANSVEEGEIKIKDAITTMIGAAIRQYDIKAKYAICTTNPTSIINREIIVPKVEVDELDTVVRYEIQQYLPINLDDCILQMTVLGEVKDEFDDRSKLNVRVIAYPKSVALSYYKLLSDLGLNPYVLDVNFNSLNKFINYTKLAEDKNKSKSSMAFIDIGANFIDVNIYKNDKLDFTRRIKSGGQDIDNILVNDGSVHPQAVMNIKTKNIDLNINELAVTKVESKLVEDVLDEWIEKIEMILQFYKNKSIENDIKKIYVFGGSSKLKGIEKYMSDKLGVNVSSLSNVDNIAFRKSEYNGEMLSDFINAIGAIIRL